MKKLWLLALLPLVGCASTSANTAKIVDSVASHNAVMTVHLEATTLEFQLPMLPIPISTTGLVIDVKMATGSCSCDALASPDTPIEE